MPFRGQDDQCVRRRILERFREANGELPFALLERKHIEDMVAAMIATPHAARHFIHALRAVISVAIVAACEMMIQPLGFE